MAEQRRLYLQRLGLLKGKEKDQISAVLLGPVIDVKKLATLVLKNGLGEHQQKGNVFRLLLGCLPPAKGAWEEITKGITKLYEDLVQATGAAVPGAKQGDISPALVCAVFLPKKEAFFSKGNTWKEIRSTTPSREIKAYCEAMEEVWDDEEEQRLKNAWTWECIGALHRYCRDGHAQGVEATQVCLKHNDPVLYAHLEDKKVDWFRIVIPLVTSWFTCCAPNRTSLMLVWERWIATLALQSTKKVTEQEFLPLIAASLFCEMRSQLLKCPVANEIHVLLSKNPLCSDWKVVVNRATGWFLKKAKL